MLDQKFINCTEAVIFIALQNGASVKGSVVCAKLGLSVRSMEKFLQQAVKNNLLIAHRGPQGGYVLAKEKRNINLSDIYSVYKEQQGPALNANSASNIIDKHLQQVNKDITHKLQKISLDSLCLDYAKKFAAGKGEAKQSYNI